MKPFDALCAEFEQLDAANYGALLAQKSLHILPSLIALNDNHVYGVTMFATFIVGAMLADGRVSEEEYLLVEPLLRAFFKDSINYDDVKKSVKQLQRESKLLKNSVDEMVDLLGTFSQELKNDIVLVCMMICAVDGKISFKEKQWIKQLIKD